MMSFYRYRKFLLNFDKSQKLNNMARTYMLFFVDFFDMYERTVKKVSKMNDWSSAIVSLFILFLLPIGS